MQKRENKAIFLRISGEIAKKRRNMQPTAKRNGSMQGFAPRKHPRQACSLDCIAKLRFAFQPALQAIQLCQHSAAAGKLTSVASRPVSSRRPYLFIPAPSTFIHSITQQQPADVICRLPIHSPLHFFSFDFCKYFSFFKKRRNFLRRQLLYCLFFCISEIDFIEYRIYEFLA